MIFVSAPAIADVPEGSVQERVDNDEDETGFELSAELRPAVGVADGRLHSDNEISVGYRFSPGFELEYSQGFQVSFRDPSGEKQGISAETCEGYLGAKFERLWATRNGRTALDYEARVYVPTDSEERRAGQIGGIRNLFSVRHELSRSVSLTVTEIPIIHFYGRPGSERDGGVATANRRFENRLQLVPEVLLSARLKIKFPVIFQAARHANYEAGARLNDGWGYGLWIHPQLTYALTRAVSVGIAYAENLYKSESTAIANLDTTRSGEAQAVLELRL